MSDTEFQRVNPLLGRINPSAGSFEQKLRESLASIVIEFQRVNPLLSRSSGLDPATPIPLSARFNEPLSAGSFGNATRGARGTVARVSTNQRSAGSFEHVGYRIDEPSPACFNQ